MKKTTIILISIFICNIIYAQKTDYITFGTNTTLDVVTWNIENFPKNGQTTLDYLTPIIESLEIDIFAFQEISDPVLFEQMVANIDGYSCYFESSWYAGLAYLYNYNTIQINDIYEIYTTEPYWSPFPRSPMVMEFTYDNEDYVLINNHLKCCGDGTLNLNDADDEENRRYIANNLLQEYIVENFPDEKVFVVGDMNDEITDPSEDNVFQNIIDNTENFMFADMEIANSNSSEWSYPTWPSHLDHILITNELFVDFENELSEIQTLKIEESLDGGWSEYDQNISDHRPVGIKIFSENTLELGEFDSNNFVFNSSPNPCKSKLNFEFDEVLENSVIEIYNIYGKRVQKINISKGQSRTVINLNNMPEGIYFAKLITNNNTINCNTIIIGN